MDNKKYFKVIAKCGRVGKNKYIPIQFAVIAENGKEAAKLVRYFPRVKHDHKDAILNVNEVNYNEYLEILENNNNDEYLKCKSRHNQKENIDLSDRLVEDYHHINIKNNKQERIDRVKYKLNKYKNILNSYIKEKNYEYIY